MEALKLSGMAIVKDLETVEEVETLRDFLLVDPLKITHSINFWRQEAINASTEDKKEIELIIQSLLKHLKNQALFTCKVYSVDNNAKEIVEPIKETTKVATIAPSPKKDVVIVPDTNPSVANMHIVKDDIIAPDINRILREKYSAIIKKINFEGLMLKVKELLASDATAPEGVELATFILGEGLYTGKKVKQWNTQAIEAFLVKCAPKSNIEDKSVTTAVETPAPDEDLHIKYACYLGDNMMSLGMLKAEAKALLSVPETQDKALEIITFILSKGLYVDDSPKEWGLSAIEEFIRNIREDIISHPLDLAKPIEEVKEISEAVVIEKPDFDVAITKLYSEIGKEVAEKDLSFDEIKDYIFTFIQTNKTETFVKHFETEVSKEDRNNIYTRLFAGYIDQQFKLKDNQKIDVKADLLPFIKGLVDAKEKTLAKAWKKASDLYKLRGEEVGFKECRMLVNSIAEENFPEYYKEMMNSLNKPVIDKLPIVEENGQFAIKYPEIYETVKGAQYLDDIYKMGRELEKTQSFLVVSEMITHLISSGKIKKSEKIQSPINWDKAQIELWINSQFAKAETVAEAAENDKLKVNETSEVGETGTETVTESSEPSQEPTKEVKETTESTTSVEPITPTVVVPEVVTPETTNPTNPVVTPVITPSTTEELSVAPTQTVIAEPMGEQPATVVTPEVANVSTTPEVIASEQPVETENLPVAQTDDETVLLELVTPKNKKDLFWQAVADTINKLTGQGKTKKEISNLIADNIKVLSHNEEYKANFVRNFKNSKIHELYQTVNKIAASMNVPGWEIATV
jgi:hypothetical protein